MSRADFVTRLPIAHRGLHDGNKARWENTLPAFEAAVAHGYAIECDVHLTADGIPIVFHDWNLDRLTGATGKVHERTAAEMGALRIGGTADNPPTLDALLDLVDGKVPLVIELKGIVGHDAGLVRAVGGRLARYRGEAAIMSFDHWLVRDFAADAPGIPAGLTAWGLKTEDFEAHFSMLAHCIDFVSYSWEHLPNPFVTFMRETLGRPVITWTVKHQRAVNVTRKHADQMTFEGFLPEVA